MFEQGMNMNNQMDPINVAPAPQDMNQILQQLFAQQQQIEDKINALTPLTATTTSSTPQCNAMMGNNNFAFQANANLPSLDGTSSTFSNSDLSQYSSNNHMNNNFMPVVSSMPLANATFSNQQLQLQQPDGSLWSDRASSLLGNIVCTNPKESRKNKRKANKDKPKRPLSAYNIFFKEERARLLSGDGANVGSDQRTANGKIKFENLAKIISGRWQSLESEKMAYYKAGAATDLERYRKEMAAWKLKKQQQDDSEEVSSVEENSETGNISTTNQHSEFSLEEPLAKRARCEAV